MSRSPWRDALDGQIAILRDLRKPVSAIHLGRNIDVPEVRASFPNPYRRAEILVEGGKALADGLETLVREAEPIHLTHDIRQYVMQKIHRRASPNLDTAIEKWSSVPALTEAMLPIPHGLLYFSGGGVTLDDIVIKALMFGPPIALSMTPEFGGLRFEMHTTRDKILGPGMGVTAFLDARRSGYENMTREFGDHIVPVILANWEYGETLIETVHAQGKMEHALGTNVSGTTVLYTLACAYLYTLFHLMLTRITRWGGVALNRTEQKEADREKLRPRVQLVTWRKANYKYPEGHIPVPKNWSCRWSVRPHYRRYKSGKVIEIKSYIKGPPNKPYRPPDTRVHDVRY